MNHLFQLGPIETDEGAAHLYFVLSPGRLEPLRATDDAGAVREASQRFGPDLVCEPGLGPAAGPGVRVEALPEDVAVDKAWRRSGP